MNLARIGLVVGSLIFLASCTSVVVPGVVNKKQIGLGVTVIENRARVDQIVVSEVSTSGGWVGSSGGGVGHKKVMSVVVPLDCRIVLIANGIDQLETSAVLLESIVKEEDDICLIQD